MADQDRARWDGKAIAEGFRLLESSASGAELSDYHLEAGIAAVHAQARSLSDTDWATIVTLYDKLWSINPSPIVGLNRAIAVGQKDGPQLGLEAIASIPDLDRLADYPFCPAAIGELALRCGDTARAREQFKSAVRLSRNATERRFFQRRLQTCD